MASTFPYDWQKRCKITIDHSKVISQTQTDFPWLLTYGIGGSDSLPTQMFDGASTCQEGGGDVRFSSDALGETRLSCEIVRCSPAANKAQIYVKIPSLSHLVDTEIYVWWSTSQTDSQPDKDAAYGTYDVWSNNYGAVFHMEETSGDLINSANAYDLTRYMDPVQDDGKIGYSQDFDRTPTADYFEGDVSPELEEAENMSWEFWLDNDYTGSSPYSWTPKILTLTKNNIANIIGIELNDEATDFSIYPFFKDVNQDYWEFLGYISVVAAPWHHYFTTVTDTRFYIWRDGADRREFSGIPAPDYPVYSASTSANNTLRIGSGFIGKIDEVRIHTINRNGNYVATTYNNQNIPGSCATAGTPTTPTWTFDFDVSDGFKIGDNLSQLTFDWNFSVSDGVELGDSSNRTIDYAFDVEDGIVLGDSESEDATFNPPATDGIKLSDAPVAAATMHEATSDGIKLGESLFGGFLLEESVSDGILFGDSESEDVEFNPTITDGFLLGDLLVIYSSVDYPCEENVEWICVEQEWQDDVRVRNEWTPPYYVWDEALEDGFTFSDEAVAAGTFNPSASDGMLFEAILAGSGFYIDVSASDGFKLGDNTTVQVVFNPNIADGIKFADVLTAALTGYSSASDGIVLGDSLGQVFNETITDGIVLGEQLIGVKTILINIIDGLKLSDSPSAVANFVVNVSDGFELGEIVAQVYNETASDGIIFGEIVSSVQYYKVKAYFTRLDKTFTFKVKKRPSVFVAKDEKFTFEVEN